MAKAILVKSARKPNPVAQVGESYWWWQFRYGGKHYSKDRPTRSQLTQSSFLSQLYSLEDEFEWGSTVDDLENNLRDFIGELETLQDECQESLDNMPDSLRDSSPTGELLQERLNALEEWIDALGNIDFEAAEEEMDDKRFDRIKGEIEVANPEIN